MDCFQALFIPEVIQCIVIIAPRMGILVLLFLEILIPNTARIYIVLYIPWMKFLKASSNQMRIHIVFHLENPDQQL